jgi:hypothetical protein
VSAASGSAPVTGEILTRQQAEEGTQHEDLRPDRPRRERDDSRDGEFAAMRVPGRRRPSLHGAAGAGAPRTAEPRTLLGGGGCLPRVAARRRSPDPVALLGAGLRCSARVSRPRRQADRRSPTRHVEPDYVQRGVGDLRSGRCGVGRPAHSRGCGVGRPAHSRGCGVGRPAHHSASHTTAPHTPLRPARSRSVCACTKAVCAYRMNSPLLARLPGDRQTSASESGDLTVRCPISAPVRINS